MTIDIKQYDRLNRQVETLQLVELEDELKALEKDNDILTAKVDRLENELEDASPPDYLDLWRLDPDPYSKHGYTKKQRLDAMGCIPEHMK